MITKDYIEMCKQAKHIQDMFMFEGDIAKDYIPSLIYVNNETKMLAYNDCRLIMFNIQEVFSMQEVELPDIIWLPFIEQLLHMYKKFCKINNNMLDFTDAIILQQVNEFYSQIIYDNSSNQKLILAITQFNMNQLVLQFISAQMFDLTWVIDFGEWKEIEFNEGLN